MSGFEEITTSFRTYGLDQLWLGSLCYGLRVDSLGVANHGFATNFASWRSAPLRIPPGGAFPYTVIMCHGIWSSVVFNTFFLLGALLCPFIRQTKDSATGQVNQKLSCQVM